MARISAWKTVTTCNTYLPPLMPVRSTDSYRFVEQLPHTFTLLGALNGHDSLWGNEHCDTVEVVCLRILTISIDVFDDGPSTYCHPASDTKSICWICLRQMIFFYTSLEPSLMICTEPIISPSLCGLADLKKS